ncbi:hypothetical protein [Polynucleobacter sp. UK-Kesae-W10]|uniref:hypothetical protein n=1 Tax=Polynucleobacter sp. UK-Kesae-W10 TaxID=1819738 RepID=UPI001C0AE860|nr:hypothetical protein [Polynucleobacter sp. UK-Kesae-W10]MBU3577504.1 hypothetical protein [Polynucleobacter sp. UK-Kesae-W10]
MADNQNTATVADSSVALVPVEQRAAVALGSSKTEEDLKALAIKHANIIKVVDKNGREQAHRAAMEVRTARTTITKVAKAARDDATKFSAAVIAEEKRLLDIIDAEEERLFTLRDEWDAEQARLAAEKAAAEKTRIDAIKTAIDSIRAIPSNVANASSDVIMAAGKDLYKLEITEEHYQEFLQEAGAEKSKALDALADILSAAKSREAEAARIEAQRIENERVAAENARIAAELAAQQAAIAAQAEAQRIAAQAEAQKAIDEANAKSRQEAAERAEMLKKQEDAFAVEKAAAEAILKEQQDKLNAEIAVIAKANAERAAQELAAKVAKELEEANARLKAQEEAKALRMAALRDRADAIVDAIANQFEVEHSTAVEYLLEAADYLRDEVTA